MLKIYDYPELPSIKRLSSVKIHIVYYVGFYYIDSDSNEVILIGYLKAREIFKHIKNLITNENYYTHCKSSIPFMNKISTSFGVKRKRINYSSSSKNIFFEHSEIQINTKDSYVIQGSDIISAYHRKRKIEKILNN